MSTVKALDTRLANPAYVVLPITGILMVLDANLGFTTFWIATAIGLFALAVLAGAFFSPSLRRQVELAAAPTEPSSCQRGPSGPRWPAWSPCCPSLRFSS